MDESKEPFWGWPGVRSLVYAYLVLGIPSFAWFALVYGGADYLTGLHTFRLPLYGDWEHQIPFIPAMAVIYNSLHVSNTIAPFILRRRSQMHALAAVWFLMTLVGGIMFLLVPFEPGYAVPAAEDLGVWRACYEFADRVNLRFNCCPSLHVAWAVANADVYARDAGGHGKVCLFLWGAATTLSTLLLHQHHVVDVVAGLSLAGWGSRYLYPRLLAHFGG